MQDLLGVIGKKELDRHKGFDDERDIVGDLGIGLLPRNVLLNVPPALHFGAVEKFEIKFVKTIFYLGRQKISFLCKRYIIDNSSFFSRELRGLPGNVRVMLMARSRSALQNHLEYAALRGLMSFLDSLPVAWSRALFLKLTQTVLFFIPRRRKLVETNIALAFPRHSAAQNKAVLHQSLENFARGLSLYGQIPARCKKGMDDVVLFDGKEHVDAALRQGRGAITFTGHYGYWEMMAIHVTRLYPLIAMVARPLDNPLLDEMTTAIRSSGGGSVIPSRRIFREGLSLLRRNGILGILIDQNFPRDGGVFVDFLGRPASTTPVVSLLARRTGCAVLPMHNRWEGDRVRIICEPPLALSQNADAEKAVQEDTQAMTTIVEGWVREDPGQWFWLHNRWKRQPESANA